MNPAREVLDYFRQSADLLSALRDARCIACGQATDNLDRAIKLARV